MASLADLKKQSENALNKFKSSMDEDTKSGSSYEDDRMWKPFFDKDKGIGQATVRFLPEPPGEEFPWVKIFTHGFKGPTGKWYIENSLTTIGQSDPVGELNSRLWNSGIESDQEVARTQKRRLSYYSNVLVVDDPANPSNNGKVFLFRYGMKIYEKLQELMSPQFEDETPINPFDPWNGCDFVIRMRTVAGYVNYDKSSFKEPAAIGSDDEIELIWKQCHSLNDLVAPKNFKSYDELKNRMYEVLGPTVGSGVPVIIGAAPVPEQEIAPAATIKEEKVSVAEKLNVRKEESSSDVDDDLKFFEELANG